MLVGSSYRRHFHPITIRNTSFRLISYTGYPVERIRILLILSRVGFSSAGHFLNFVLETGRITVGMIAGFIGLIGSAIFGIVGGIIGWKITKGSKFKILIVIFGIITGAVVGFVAGFGLLWSISGIR